MEMKIKNLSLLKCKWWQCALRFGLLPIKKRKKKEKRKPES